MSLRHLTDNEIQDYLDGRFSQNGRYVSDHIESCDYCQAQLAQYQTLFGALRKEVPFRLPASFSNNLLAKLAQEPKASPRLGAWAALFAFLALVLGTEITLFFTGVKPLVATWTFVQRVANAINLEWLASINAFLAGLNLNLSLLGSAIFVVALISVIDYMLLRPRHKIASFFKMMVV